MIRCLLLVVMTRADLLPTKITITDDASASERYAASMLQSHLQIACPDLTFTVGPPKGSRPGSEIIVGPGAALHYGLPAETLTGLGNESYYLGYFAPPLVGSVVLTGGIGSTRSTVYAVYSMLTDVIGFNFFAHDETAPPMECLSDVPHFDITNSPAFEYRDNNQFQPTTQLDWSTAVAYNGRVADATHGSYVKYADPPGFVHTSYNILAFPDSTWQNHPPPALYKAHPEWFWPRGAAGASTYGQLCWSNASLVAFVTEQARKILRADANATILSISQNDNGVQCEDPAEKAVNDKEGSPIGALLNAVNAVADALADEFPHVAFDTLAYQWTRSAPTSGLKPRPNVIIRLCTIECDFAHPLTHENNAPFQKDMAAWAALSKRTYIWDYVTNFQHYVAPFPNWHVLVPNLRFFHEHGVQGVFEEGTYNTPGGDLVQLKDYLLAKALWNPNIDDDDATTQFLGYYYDSAAVHVKTYMDAMVEGIDGSAYYMHESFDVNAPFLTPALLLRSAQAFANASAAVASKDVRFMRRVEEAALPVMYVALFRWDELRAYASSAKLTWPYNETLRPQFDEFKRVYQAVGIKVLDEAGHTIDWMESVLFPTAGGLLSLVGGRDGSSSRRGSSLHWRAS